MSLNHALEDQTDEDFFDKLVDGDVDNSESVSNLVTNGGSDFDETKGFGSVGLSGVEESSNSNTLGLIDSLGSDIVNELNDDGVGLESEVGSDAVQEVSKSIDSVKSGVKEVGWSSFYADSLPNGNHGFDSYSDFFNELGDGSEEFRGKEFKSGNLESNDGSIILQNSVSCGVHQEGMQSYGGGNEESIIRQDLNDSQYLENVYPGWKYDTNTGQWYQVDSFDVTTSAQQSIDANVAENEQVVVSDVNTELSYLQQTSQTAAATVAETCTSENLSVWNQVSEGTNNGYPEHMVFDPQYPGWYYDTIAQEWRSLECYSFSAQLSNADNHDQKKQNNLPFGDAYSQNSNSIYGGYEQADKHGSQGYTNQGQHANWGESDSNYNRQDLNLWQPGSAAKTNNGSHFVGNQISQNEYGSNLPTNNLGDQQQSFNSLGRVQSYENVSQHHVQANGFVGSRGFIPTGNFTQQYNQRDLKQSEPMSISNDYLGGQDSVQVGNQSYQSSQQHFSYAPSTARSSAGRPPHALVTFGFGGKLIIANNNSSSSLGNSSFGSQEPVRGSICVLNLMEVVCGNANKSPSVGGSFCNYFGALCLQSFPGPLVGGNVGNKELNKWIDERLASYELSDMDNRNGEILKLLFSLLKIACQHYGKLRSPFGVDASMKESDSPESSVAKLFASVKRNGAQIGEYSNFNHCLQNFPSEGQIQATASEVQNLLVSGRKKDALQCAQEGQLWGPALVIASQLGDQFYIDTVKQMAVRQLVAGSPLRTLCLLIAGQPADVFSSNTSVDGSIPGAVIQQPIQFGANSMLDDWQQNLAVITANRTKDDELVIMHLGDCLWKETSEIRAAHICYLVAEANFESYLDSARLCLIGADHWRQPRTYANPEAIQRTELYEYSKVLGNSQFILLPFQPYKLVYAYMLAEVGKVSDSLKYCQALLRSLKTGRAPEIETWKQLVLSLEERIRAHQQGGYTANLAPARLVGKLLNFFDSTAHRVVGSLPPTASSALQGSVHSIEHYHQPLRQRVSASQSTMAMSSLMPSASMEPITDWAADSNKMSMHNRSASEPDFGRTPRQVGSPEERTSSSAQGKTTDLGGASRLRRFGFGSQLFQKTVGLVLGPRSDRQAKLGEKNKFYYDEKLKRWVEEGAEPPSEETALPPPPTTSSFHNGMSDYKLISALKNDGSPPNGSPKSRIPADHSSGIPPIPTISNQFSARGRIGVRARYVDTFNQGVGSSANSFHSPSVPTIKQTVSTNAKFFVPSPPTENSMQNITENVQESTGLSENTSMPTDNSVHSPLSFSKMNMQRFPSMDNISRKERTMNGHASVPSHSRRTASWGGNLDD